MDTTGETREYGADKIALLGLFIAALLLAYFVCASRSADPAIDVIAKIKDRGLDSFFEIPGQSDFFLIKDAGKRTIGFTMDVLVNYGPAATPNVEAASCSYIPAQYAQEQTALFQSDNRFIKNPIKGACYV